MKETYEAPTIEITEFEIREAIAVSATSSNELFQIEDIFD